MHRLYQSNRLENLLTALCEVLAEPVGSPLAPEVVVVQNPGMARWLAQQIAMRMAICANMEFPLPALREISAYLSDDRDGGKRFALAGCRLWLNIFSLDILIIVEIDSVQLKLSHSINKEKGGWAWLQELSSHVEELQESPGLKQQL